jgi:two-component system response regulator BaeR
MTMILIVEDEQKLAELIKDYLAQSSFDTTILDNGNDVVPYVRENKPDLVILDLMLPGRDGMEICKEIRTFSNLPIIMVTARVEEIDRLLGLELGADDYVCKPFSPRELVARVKAVLRRAGGETTIKAKGLVLDEARYQASLHGVDLQLTAVEFKQLTAVEFKLLSFLAANPGRIYSRDQLMERIYSDHRIVSDRTIDSHIKKLRKKISGQSPDEELIGSVYGVGYKFI